MQPVSSASFTSRPSPSSRATSRASPASTARGSSRGPGALEFPLALLPALALRLALALLACSPRPTKQPPVCAAQTAEPAHARSSAARAAAARPLYVVGPLAIGVRLGDQDSGGDVEEVLAGQVVECLDARALRLLVRWFIVAAVDLARRQDAQVLDARRQRQAKREARKNCSATGF